MKSYVTQIIRYFNLRALTLRGNELNEIRGWDNLTAL